MKSNSSKKTTALLPVLPADEIDTALSLPENNPVKKNNPLTVVAIGASAGGLEAITQLLKNLSPTTGMAFIFVQHLSPDHKSMLASILSKTTQMQVQDIDDMEKEDLITCF